MANLTQKNIMVCEHSPGTEPVDTKKKNQVTIDLSECHSERRRGADYIFLNVKKRK